jgi:hypothetical protein
VQGLQKRDNELASLGKVLPLGMGPSATKAPARLDLDLGSVAKNDIERLDR